MKNTSLEVAEEVARTCEIVNETRPSGLTGTFTQMTASPTLASTVDVKAITQVLEMYAKGARSGGSADLKPAFNADATIHGYIGPELFGGPIQLFYDWHDNNGPASGLAMKIASIDVEGTIATARVELDDWTGHRFTDMFTLLKVDGQWKIISKVFHLHG
jgi:hypothetical protein